MNIEQGIGEDGEEEDDDYDYTFYDDEGREHSHYDYTKQRAKSFQPNERYVPKGFGTTDGPGKRQSEQSATDDQGVIDIRWNFERLVLGCIEADFGKYTLLFIF